MTLYAPFQEDVRPTGCHGGVMQGRLSVVCGGRWGREEYLVACSRRLLELPRRGRQPFL